MSQKKWDTQPRTITNHLKPRTRKLKLQETSVTAICKSWHNVNEKSNVNTINMRVSEPKGMKKERRKVIYWLTYTDNRILTWASEYHRRYSLPAEHRRIVVGPWHFPPSQEIKSSRTKHYEDNAGYRGDNHPDHFKLDSEGP